MLRHLRVRDFALVTELDIELASGLTVITGESGAGKSILIEALGHVLGDRAAATDVRPGAERSDVTAEFDIHDNPEARVLLIERALTDTDDPERCLLRRVMSADGRSRGFINGTAVTRQDLAALTATLIDIHGQNEHQSLLKREVQLTLLDDYAGNNDLCAEVAACFDAWHQAARDCAELSARITQSQDRAALLQYQVNELDTLAVTPGEFEELDARFRRLAKRQEIAQILDEALGVLDGEDASGVNELRRLDGLLGRINDDDTALRTARELIDTAITQLDESRAELRHYTERLANEPDSLGTIERRLDEILGNARKHRVRPDVLHEHHAALTAELNALAVDTSSLTTLEREVGERRAQYVALAERLRESRKRAAKPYAGAVSKLLQKLGIRGGSLVLEFTDAESRAGLEMVEYWVVTNPKYPAAPLARIASGGERSRMSLAIQVVAAERSRLKTLVLDEADVGIGGATADVVGRLLRKLAAQTQVLCVTHAPQVAALGEHHLRVVKTRDQNTRLEPLDRAARVQELARMLSGSDITNKTLEYAEELIAAGVS